MFWPLRALGALHGYLAHERRVDALAAHLADLIPRGHSVLDVGCGDGRIDRLILNRRPDLQISGVDPLVRPATHIPVMSFDGRRLPFPDGSWDSVMFCDVLHHTHQPQDLIVEAARVARYNVLIKDHNLQGIFARPTLALMDLVGNAPHGVAVPFNYLTSEEWQRSYEVAGLVPREVRRSLKLYSRWLEPLFGRSLHFLAVLEIQRAGAARRSD